MAILSQPSRKPKPRTFGAVPRSGFEQIAARLSKTARSRVLAFLGVLLLAVVGIQWLVIKRRPLSLRKIRNKAQQNLVFDKDVPQLQYYIPSELVPKGQVRIIGRDFSNERITTDDNRESFLGIEAIREYGDEIRQLVQLGGESLMLGTSNGATESSLAFRKRLHARAPWLKGNPTEDPQWPLSTLPKPVEGGQAIMICAGDKQLALLKTLLYAIRVIHKSQIPIRIVFRDDKDLTEKSQTALLESLPSSTDIPTNLQFIDLSQVFDLDAANLKAGWNLKPFGLLAVPETQIITLDVDVILLQPPESIFQTGGYVEKGALFFHDRMFVNFLGFYDPAALAKTLQPDLSSTANDIIHYGKKEYISEHIMESGLTVLDKSRRMLGIWAVCLLMGRTDIRAYVQGYYVYGDKELYWIGMETVSEPYSFAKYYPGTYGSVVTNFDGTDIAISPNDKDKDETKELERIQADRRFGLCGRIVHFDDTGQPLWSNGGYSTKEDDWSTRWNSKGKVPLNPIWFADGGIWKEEEFFPNIQNPPDPPSPQPGWLASWFTNPTNNDPAIQAVWERGHKDWMAAMEKGGPNQRWQTHGGMAVMCLLPNARGIRAVPKNTTKTALMAVERFFS